MTAQQWYARHHTGIPEAHSVCSSPVDTEEEHFFLSSMSPLRHTTHAEFILYELSPLPQVVSVHVWLLPEGQDKSIHGLQKRIKGERLTCTHG